MMAIVHPAILRFVCMKASSFNWIKVRPGISQFVTMKASSIQAQVKVPGSKNILE